MTDRDAAAARAAWWARKRAEEARRKELFGDEHPFEIQPYQRAFVERLGK